MTFEKGRKKIWASVVLRSFSQMAFYSAKGSLIRGWNSKSLFRKSGFRTALSMPLWWGLFHIKYRDDELLPPNLQSVIKETIKMLIR